MAQRWYSSHLDHQTVEFGAKGRTGPSPGVVQQLRWAGARVSEGGWGPPHPHLAVRAAERDPELWKGGWWGGMMVVGRGRTDRPDGVLNVALDDSAGG